MSAPEPLLDHEQLQVQRGLRTDLQIVIAVHSTALGPALGGARLWHYGTPGDAIADALRLSEGMTQKAAAAGLDLGGGKCVICADGELGESRRRELMLDLGDAVESLDGAYITAEDVGTCPADMAIVKERTDYVTGLPAEVGGSGDPSPLTARGVESAIRTCCDHAFGSPELEGRRICVVGIGHVGSHLAARLARAGAQLVISDVDGDKRALAPELGAEWVEPEQALFAECDVMAPCALGGTVDRQTVERLRCRIVCGSANNVLGEEVLADQLADRKILYAPDFIANAGGLISVHAEFYGLDHDRIGELVDGIGPALETVLDESDRAGITPLAAARRVASKRLEGARNAAPVLGDREAGRDVTVLTN